MEFDPRRLHARHRDTRGGCTGLCERELCSDDSRVEEGRITKAKQWLDRVRVRDRQRQTVVRLWHVAVERRIGLYRDRHLLLCNARLVPLVPAAEDDDNDEPRCCPICGIGALLAHRLVAPIPVRGVDTS